MNKPLAFHNDPAIKRKLMDALHRDQAADAIQKGLFVGKYGNDVGFKGCAIGCAVQAFRGMTNDNGTAWHSALELDTGIPEQLNYVIDGLFESLPEPQNKQFAVNVFESMPIGADLSMVASNLMLDILADPEKGLLQLPNLKPATKATIEDITALYRRRLSDDEPTIEDWQKARHAAYAAAAYAYAAASAYAAYAAAAAASAYAADGADAAAYAAADAAAYAADGASAYAAAAAASASAYAAAARREARLWQRDRLVHHLSNAPILEVSNV